MWKWCYLRGKFRTLHQGLKEAINVDYLTWVAAWEQDSKRSETACSHACVVNKSTSIHGKWSIVRNRAGPFCPGVFVWAVFGKRNNYCQAGQALCPSCRRKEKPHSAHTAMTYWHRNPAHLFRQLLTIFSTLTGKSTWMGKETSLQKEFCSYGIEWTNETHGQARHTHTHVHTHTHTQVNPECSK